MGGCVEGRKKGGAGGLGDLSTPNDFVTEGGGGGPRTWGRAAPSGGDPRHYTDLVVELMKENLRRYLEGQELLNLFDPEKGY